MWLLWSGRLSRAQCSGQLHVYLALERTLAMRSQRSCRLETNKSCRALQLGSKPLPKRHGVAQETCRAVLLGAAKPLLNSGQGRVPSDGSSLHCVIISSCEQR